MSTRITIDHAGRVVIPKAVRDGLRLHPGDALELDSFEDHLVLTPVRSRTPLAKKEGIWIHRPDRPVPEDAIQETIESVRAERFGELFP